MCHAVVISLAIIAHLVNGVAFSPIALFQARAAHESTYCASMPHENELARNSTSLRLHMSTRAQKRANNAGNMLDLHHTIIWHRVIVSKGSMQALFMKGMQRMGLGVCGEGACEHRWIKITS